jgi:hypothetical protein
MADTITTYTAPSSATPTLRAYLYNNGSEVSATGEQTPGTGFAIDNPSYTSNVLTVPVSLRFGVVTGAIDEIRIKEGATEVCRFGLEADEVFTVPTDFIYPWPSAGVTFGTNYVLNASQGDYGITGYAAALRYNRVLPASIGSVAISAPAANLLFKRVMAATPAAYAATGVDAGLFYNRLVAAAVGAFAINAPAIALLYHRLIGAAGAGFDIVADAAGLLYNPAIQAQPGGFAVTPVDVTLIYDASSHPHNYTLVAEAGGLDIVGRDAELLHDRLLTALSADFVLQLFSAGLRRAAKIAADPAMFQFIGRSSRLIYSSAPLKPKMRSMTISMEIGL